MMRGVAYNEELAQRIRETLADRTDVEEKKMFGGLTFMVAGQMSCGVLKDDLIVRIESSEFDELVAQPGVRPFDFSGRPMQGMVYVDNGALADAAVLRRGYSAALTMWRRIPLRPRQSRASAASHA
jgi:TfoX/Sxy family transcriptional regulator of competence genes